MTGLWDALEIRIPSIIAIVGSGGKTTLMFRLARMASEKGLKTLTTTTTKIFHPSPEQSPLIILEEEVDSLARELESQFSIFNPITAARAVWRQGKLDGLEPAVLDDLLAAGIPDLVLAEADGSRRLPVKAPGPLEPVIPAMTDLVIPVIGLSGLGLPLDDEHVFRPLVFSQLSGIPVGGAVTCRGAAAVIAGASGFLGKCPTGSSIIPFLNQADAVDPDVPVELAREILGQSGGRIEKVVWGSLSSPADDFQILTS